MVVLPSGQFFHSILQQRQCVPLHVQIIAKAQRKELDICLVSISDLGLDLDIIAMLELPRN